MWTHNQKAYGQYLDKRVVNGRGYYRESDTLHYVHERLRLACVAQLYRKLDQLE